MLTVWLFVLSCWVAWWCLAIYVFYLLLLGCVGWVLVCGVNNDWIFLFVILFDLDWLFILVSYVCLFCILLGCFACVVGGVVVCLFNSCLFCWELIKLVVYLLFFWFELFWVCFWVWFDLLFCVLYLWFVFSLSVMIDWFVIRFINSVDWFDSFFVALFYLFSFRFVTCWVT